MELDKRSLFFLAVAVAFIIELHPGVSRGCTPPYCWGGFFLPGKGNVPANVGAIRWWPYDESWLTPEVDESNVSIHRVSGAEEIEVPFLLESTDESSYLLRLVENLVPGSEYVLRCDDLCLGEEIIETRFLASLSSPSTVELGLLVAGEPRLEEIRVATPSGSCDTPVTAAIVDVQLQLGERAGPWADVFFYYTYVDGEEWYAAASLGGPGPGWEIGGNWMGRGKDRLYVLCASRDPYAHPGVEEGSHRVEMRAKLPGSELEIHSNVVSVELYCTAPVTEEETEEAAGEPDPAATEKAGEVAEAAEDAGEEEPSPPRFSASGGCSVSAPV